MIALRIIIVCAIVFVTVKLCLHYAPTVGAQLRRLWRRLTGEPKSRKWEES